MTKKIKKKKNSAKKIQKGAIGNFFVYGILILLVVLGVVAIGGLPSSVAPQTGQVVNIISPTKSISYNNLQLKTFGYITVTPILNHSQQLQCKNSNFNQEPENYIASDPVPPQTAMAGGYIRVWACDENSPYLAPGALVNNTTGQITNSGDITAKDDNGNTYAPRLYVDGDNIVSNLHPIYPDFVKGHYGTPNGSAKGPGLIMDPLPANHPGKIPCDNPSIQDEYLWSVNSIISQLGLQSGTGTHQVQFVIHDGDDDQGLGCASFTM